MEHQLFRGLSVTGGYYHNWDGNIRALVNTAVTPADFDPPCKTPRRAEAFFPIEALFSSGDGAARRSR